MTEYACPMVEHRFRKKGERRVLELYCGKFNYDVSEPGCELYIEGDLLYCLRRHYDSFIGRFSGFDMATARQAKEKLIGEWNTARTSNPHPDTTI